MKNLILILAIVLTCLVSFAQKVTKDSNGNYVSVTKKTTEPVSAGINYIDSKGISHPLYTTGNSGRLYYLRVSAKTGKEYKAYIQIQ